jgi:DNA-binding NarL/FixJ family response regulator
VLLVEGHALLREALEHILRGQLGLERFAYAENGDAAIRAAAELEPWLVLIDFSLPDMNGLEAARRILECAPAIHIVG